MEGKTDISVGIVPVHADANGARLFCMVHHAAGHWAFPKGHRDAGESPEQTARRELYEETGIDRIDLDTTRTFHEHYSFERDGARWDKQVTYFVGMSDATTHTTPDAFKTEIAEVRRLPYEQAKALLTFPEAKALLDEVAAYLNRKV